MVAVTLLLPVLLRYREAHDRLGMVRSMDEVRFFSADASAILAPPHLLSIWGRYGQFRAPEAQLFPGLTIVLLVAAGYLRGGWPRALARPRWQRRLHQVARAITVGSIAALTARLIFGPYQLGILGLNILSVDRHDKTLSYVMIASLVWLLNSPVVVAARARRSLAAALHAGRDRHLHPGPRTGRPAAESADPLQLALQLAAAATRL